MRYSPSPVSAELSRLFGIRNIHVIHGGQVKNHISLSIFTSKQIFESRMTVSFVLKQGNIPNCTSHALGFIAQVSGYHQLPAPLRIGPPVPQDITVEHIHNPGPFVQLMTNKRYM